MSIDVSTTVVAKRLAYVLAQIQEDTEDEYYFNRNRHVVEALYLADSLGYGTGIGFDEHEPDWPVAYIELPQGQVSWHMSKPARGWDGHSTAVKDERVQFYVERILS